MANKITQKDYYNEIIALANANGRADLAEFAQGRIDALAKKAGTKKPTKTQEANVGVKNTIVDTLAQAGKALTVTEIIGTGALPEGTSNQKVTALLRQLVDEGAVTKTTEKKVSRFAVAEAEPEADGTDAEAEGGDVEAE